MTAPAIRAGRRVFVLNVTGQALNNLAAGGANRQLQASKFMELTSGEYADPVIDTWYDAGSLHVYQRLLPEGSYAGGNLQVGGAGPPMEDVI